MINDLMVNDSNTPVFIVGVGRSGTSLMQSMLHAHSGIVFLPETQFFRKYVADKKQAKLISQKGISYFKKLLFKDEKFSRLDISVHQLFASFEDGDKITAIQIYKNLLAGYSKKEKVNIIGDKDPRNIDYLPHIKEYFPSAKIIHIYRDPRDVVLSKTKAAWSAARPYWFHALIGEVQLKNGHQKGKAFNSSQFLETRYEDLITNPVKSLQLICKFLGIKFEESMLQFSTAAKDLVTTSEMQWKKETLGPLLAKNKEKWRVDLQISQIRAIESINSVAFSEYAYEKSIHSIHSFQKIQYFFLKIISKIFSFLYLFFLQKK